MHIHHLCVLNMCPMAGPLVNRHRRLVAHALLLELPDSLVLVETGLGTDDLAQPSRLGPARWVAGFRYEPAVTARARVQALGFSVTDVRHVVLTHLDVDHAGGLSDFPHATVHVHADELTAARRPGVRDRLRYRARQWAHGPRWQPAEGAGEPWFGFDAVRDLPGLPPEVLLVPLPGHSPGHCGVAVDRGDRWLLHCGDAYFQHSEIVDGTRSIGLGLFQWFVQHDKGLRWRNQERLATLRREHGDRVTAFCAHDPDEYMELAGGLL